MSNNILEPDLAIIDPHHHLWDLSSRLSAMPDPKHPFTATISLSSYYTFPEFNADLRAGHRVLGTVFMECGAFYRANGPDHMKVIGEVEFVCGVAAQGASGIYGDCRPCSAIVGHADLKRGDAAKPVLEALISVGNSRLRGIRQHAAWDANFRVLGTPYHTTEATYARDDFREGFRHLQQLGLSFDAWVLEPQINDVTALARAFPGTVIVLDHCGTPLGMDHYHGRLPERFDIWRRSIRELGTCPNVRVKLGGLAMPCCGMPDRGPEAGIDTETLAQMWRPYIETCIEAFGPERAMFESNYPVDRWGADYATLWNVFKLLAKGASPAEKRALFAGTAAEVYQIEYLLDGI